MILYNTLMGFCAGLIMIVAADAAGKLRQAVSGPEGLFRPFNGHAAALAVLGAPLTVLSAAMALTWPLTVNPPINIAFAEPSLLLGIMALVGAAVLARLSGNGSFEIKVTPVTWVIAGTGAMLAAIAIAIWRFNLVGDAPPQEPITGQIHGWENFTFGAVYMIAAIGCLVSPLWWRLPFNHIMRICWIVAGLFFLLFSILNYYTHIGLLINLNTGTEYRW